MLGISAADMFGGKSLGIEIVKDNLVARRQQRSARGFGNRMIEAGRIGMGKQDENVHGRVVPSNSQVTAEDSRSWSFRGETTRFDAWPAARYAAIAVVSEAASSPAIQNGCGADKADQAGADRHTLAPPRQEIGIGNVLEVGKAEAGRVDGRAIDCLAGDGNGCRHPMACAAESNDIHALGRRLARARASPTNVSTSLTR